MFSVSSRWPSAQEWPAKLPQLGAFLAVDRPSLADQVAAVPDALLVQFGQRCFNRLARHWQIEPGWSVEQVYGRPDFPKVLRQHLLGRFDVAVDGSDAHRQARWLCIDCDAGGTLADEWYGVMVLYRVLLALGLSPWCEVHPDGCRLWVWLNTPLPVRLVAQMGQRLIAWAADAQHIDADAFHVYPDCCEAATSGHVIAAAVPLPFTLLDTGGFAPWVDVRGKVQHGPTLMDALSWLCRQPLTPSGNMLIAAHTLSTANQLGPQGMRQLRDVPLSQVTPWLRAQGVYQ